MRHLQQEAWLGSSRAGMVARHTKLWPGLALGSVPVLTLGLLNASFYICLSPAWEQPSPHRCSPKMLHEVWTQKWFPGKHIPPHRQFALSVP